MKRFLPHVAVAVMATFFCSLSLFAQNGSPYWSTSGNNNVTGTSKLGTTNSIGLHFYTNNLQRMFIDSLNGRVGIGVSSPSDRLHVNSASGENAFRAQVGGATRFLVHSNGGVAIGANTVPPPNGGLYVSGNVGIGTNTPAAILDVKGDAIINTLTVGLGGGNLAGNTVVGLQAFHSNTEGFNNTATGYAALFSNINGSNNTATGYAALFANINGSANTANGYNSLLFNTTGSGNTAVGFSALDSNTTGSDNTACGSAALFRNKTGMHNTAVGGGALNYNSTGSDNSACGSSALGSNTTGSYNTATGVIALSANTTGNNNTANGYQALSFNTTGFDNTANGFEALYNNTTGFNNTADGYSALYSNSSGSDNTALGNYAYPSNGTISNYTALGYNAGGSTSTSNEVEIGNTSVSIIRGQVNFSTYSDKRVKNNIQQNVPGLAFITRLTPVTYKLDIHKENDMMYADKMINGKSEKDIDFKGKYDLEKKQTTGFLAQDVEAAAEAVHYDFSGVVKPQNDHDLYSLRYSDFVVPLVKAVQELSKQNDSLSKQNASLTERMNKLEAALIAPGNGASATTLSPSLQTVQLGSAATLEQNIPNPFFNSTTINYYLPQNNGNSYINFISANGTLLKSVKLSGNGKGTLTLKTSDLPSGVYRYNLLVNGINIDSKQMVLSK